MSNRGIDEGGLSATFGVLCVVSVGGGGWLCWAVTSRPVRRHYLLIEGPLGLLLCALIRWVAVWAGCPHRHLSGLDALMCSGQTPRQAAEWLPGSWVPLGLVARETWCLASFEASGQMLARSLRAVSSPGLSVWWCGCLSLMVCPKCSPLR